MGNMEGMHQMGTSMSSMDMSSATDVNPATPPGDGSQPFCTGKGAVMLNGFASVYHNTCIKYLFEDAIIDTPGKYGLAVIGTFFLAFLSEAIRFLRARILAEKHPFNKSFLDVSKLSSSTKDLVLALSYGAQMVVAYFLMLLVMLYEVAIFSAIIFGLFCGFFVFSRIDNRRKALPDSNCNCEDEIQPTVKTKTVAVPVATTVSAHTPCCGGNSV